MAEQHLDLLKFTAGSATQFRGRPTQVMGCNPGNSDGCRVGLEKLPDDLLAYGVTDDTVAAIHRAEYRALSNSGSVRPSVYRHLGPGWHRHRTHAVVFPDEV